MRRTPARTAAVAVALTLSAACTSSRQVAQYRAAVADNQQQLEDLRLGMTEDEVYAVMGQGDVIRHKKIQMFDPWRSEAFRAGDGTAVRILFYLTQPQVKCRR